ncbi:MAG: hypothetical protein ACLRNK_00235 [Agathobacter rectalis]
MREKFIRFMNGRNGMDELARAESWIVMILLLVSIFTRSAILDILAIGLMIHMYFRVFSRNVNKRYAENQKFLNARYEWTVKAERRKKHFAQRKQYKFFKCPMCKQEVRVPRGHGKICITCPKCREQFVRRS